MTFPFMLSAFKQLLVLLVLIPLDPVLAIFLLLPQPRAVPIRPLYDGIKDLMVIRLRNVELLSPGWETSWQAGRCFIYSCWCFWLFSHLPPGPSFILKIPGRLWCLCFGFSSSSFSLWLCDTVGNSYSLTSSGSRIIPLRLDSHRFDWLF